MKEGWHFRVNFEHPDDESLRIMFFRLLFMFLIPSSPLMQGGKGNLYFLARRAQDPQQNTSFCGVLIIIQGFQTVFSSKKKQSFSLLGNMVKYKWRKIFGKKKNKKTTCSAEACFQSTKASRRFYFHAQEATKSLFIQPRYRAPSLSSSLYLLQ